MDNISIWIGLAVLGALLVYLGYLLGSRHPRSTSSRPTPSKQSLRSRGPESRPSHLLEGKELSEADASYVRDLVVAGRKIEAIKVVRERTGSSLRSAHTIVEAIDREVGPRR